MLWRSWRDIDHVSRWMFEKTTIVKLQEMISSLALDMPRMSKNRKADYKGAPKKKARKQKEEDKRLQKALPAAEVFQRRESARSRAR